MAESYKIIDDEHGIGKVLILQNTWSDTYYDVMTTQKIAALRLSNSAGFYENSIEFVRNLKFLRSIEVYSNEITNLEPLTGLPNIEVLGLMVKAAKGLKGWQPPLRVVMAQWCKQFEFILQVPTIQYLNIINYPFTNFTPLEGLRVLRRLSITSRKLVSPEGVERLSELEKVDLYNCPNLESVDTIRRLPSLRVLEVEACRHISKERLIEKMA